MVNPKYLPLVTNAKETRKSTIAIEGGRGAGKSHEVAARQVLKSLNRKTRFGLVRKVADTIRHSQFQEIKDVVHAWGLDQYFTFLESRLEIQNVIGSTWICKGLDRVEKTKSLANLGEVWIEEATELTKDDWETFRWTIRGGQRLKQKILTWNRQAGNWTEQTFFNADGSFREDENIYHLHTTFADNKFLDAAFLRDIATLKAQYPDLYKKVALGLPVQLKGLILTNWTIDEFPEDAQDVLAGIDFGTTDPTVVGRVAFRGDRLYVDELFYRRDSNNKELRAELPHILDKSVEIWADSEDANRISEIEEDGWDIKPADKSGGSVSDGIDLLKQYQIVVSPRSTNIQKDLGNWKWRTDRNGNTIIPNVPGHAFSHGCDMIRYPVYSRATQTARLEQEDVDNVYVEELSTLNIASGY